MVNRIRSHAGSSCSNMNDANEGRQITFPLLILVAYLTNANAELLSSLHDTFAVVGNPVNFTCSSNISADIHWGQNDAVVYAGGSLKKPFDQRFRMDKDETTGTFTLILLNATLDDAAEYKCRDDEGRGQESSARLTVLESYPECQSNTKVDGFVGPNQCGIRQDVMTFTCTVSFNGKTPLLLTRSSALPVGESVCENGTNRITCRLSLVATKEFDGSSITCLVSASKEKQYNCSIQGIKVNYFRAPNSNPSEGKMKNEIFCLADSNQALRFAWMVSRDNKEEVVGRNRSHVIQSPGQHWCNVSYTIGGVECFSVGPIVYARSDEQSYQAWVPWMLFGLLILSIIVLVAFFFIHRKRKRKGVINRQKEYSELLKDSETIARQEETGFSSVIETKASQESQCPIYGQAIFDDELFTISRGCKEFEVYEYTGGRIGALKRCCPVDGLKDPRNIVACKVKNCLYIENMLKDNELNEIIRVNKEDGKVLNRWEIDKPLGRISVTSESNVLVTVRGNKSSLLEFTPEGEILRKIKIDKRANINNLRHALFLDTGHYVLCHGDEKDAVNRVCIVDKKGKVLTTFGDESTDSEKKLTDPQYLAAHPNGSILVVDYQRVVLLNRQLHFKEVLLKDETNMRCTYRVCLDIENGRLLVTDNEYFGNGKTTAKGRVFVYPVVYPSSNQPTTSQPNQRED